MYTLQVQPLAADEIQAAYEWLYERSPQAADRWFRGLWKALRNLEHLPKRCPVAPESRVFEGEVRQLIYGQYKILFAVEADTVKILHVRHVRRAPLT